jgi:glycosyltransferase involved in cell wall biosynthesis
VIKKKYLLLIPAFNEEKNIEKVINKILAFSKLIDFLIINDGSDDSTKNIISKYKNIKLINNCKNIGYSKTIQKGIEYAINKNFDFLITIDADNQFNYRQVILNYIKYSKKFNLILGKRKNHRRLFEIVFGAITNLLMNIKDPMCGAKGFDVHILKKLNKVKNPTIFGLENIIMMKNYDIKVKQLRIKISERKDNSKIGNFFLGNLKIFYAIFKFFYFYLFLNYEKKK